MNPSCIGEPVSWLRLEQYALGELPAEEATTIRAHLGACAACQAAMAHLEARSLPLPAFDPATSTAAARGRGREQTPADKQLLPEWLRRPRLWIGFSLAGAVAASALLFVTSGDARWLSGASDGVKGTEFAIELVREHAGESADPTLFASGDRFRVLATCPPGRDMSWDVAIYQSGRAFFPLIPGRLTCANRRPLPGAFSLSGAEPVLVCLVLAEQALDRRALVREGKPQLPETSACVVAVPAGAGAAAQGAPD